MKNGLLIGVAFCLLLCSCTSEDGDEKACILSPLVVVTTPDSNHEQIEIDMKKGYNHIALHEVNATITFKYDNTSEERFAQYWSTWEPGETKIIVPTLSEARFKFRSAWKPGSKEGSIQKVTLNLEFQEGKATKTWVPSEWNVIRRFTPGSPW